jgi:hypothetical protein
MERVVSSAFNLAKHKDKLQVCFYIDEDDLVSHKKAIELMERYDVDFILGPRIVLSQMWNEAFRLAKYDILQHSGDDIEFQTPDWDERVYEGFEKFDDRIVMVGGNDGSGKSVHDGNFFTHGFLHRNAVEIIGYFMPPYFSSDYNDTWQNEVYKGINRWVHVDIMTEHFHPNFGKAETDATHLDRIVRHRRDNVAQLYDNLAPERNRDKEKLQAHINFMEKIK